MNLHPLTLLFSLALSNGLTGLSLLLAAGHRRDGARPNGMAKWALAVVLETAVWIVVVFRGPIPAPVSIVLASGLKASVHALALSAIHEFQQRDWPRWQGMVPVALSLLVAGLWVDNLQMRAFWCSLVFALQVAMIARALRAHADSRESRAGRLLFAGACGILALLLARATVAWGHFGLLTEPFSSDMPHPVQVAAYVLILATTLLGSMSFVLMVKERSDREILSLAMTDGLTRLLNRHALMQRAEAEFARRSKTPFAVLMIDVDHFKRINDTLGHPTGDEVLRRLAELFGSRLRRCDVLGRYGGEEFCVAAPDTDLDGALALAESLREIVVAEPVATERGPLPITVSVGVAVCERASQRSLKDVLGEADAALYRAKEAGRNRVMVAGDHPPPKALGSDQAAIRSRDHQPA